MIMNCTECESQVCDYADGLLEPAERAKVAAHLDLCPSCNAFYQDLRQLDKTLQAGIAVPSLRPDFDDRLWEKIDAGSHRLPETMRAERKRIFEVEFQAGADQLKKSFSWVSAVLDGVGYAAIGAAALGLLVRVVPSLPELELPSAAFPGGQPTLLACAGAVVFLAMGLSMAFQRRTRLLLRML